MYGDEGTELNIVCGTWIKDDDQIVIDMLNASDRKLSVEEISTMTGIPEHKIKSTLSKLTFQRHLYEGRKSYFRDEEIEVEGND